MQYLYKHLYFFWEEIKSGRPDSTVLRKANNSIRNNNILSPFYLLEAIYKEVSRNLVILPVGGAKKNKQTNVHVKILLTLD